MVNINSMRAIKNK